MPNDYDLLALAGGLVLYAVVAVCFLGFSWRR